MTVTRLGGFGSLVSSQVWQRACRSSSLTWGLQKFFTHRLVSTFDRSPFQLTGELFLYGMARLSGKRMRSPPSPSHNDDARRPRRVMTQLANLAPGHREPRPHVLAEAQVRRDANDRARVAFNARAEKAKERTTAEDAKCDDGRDADAARRPRRQRASTSNPNDAGALPDVRETTDDDVAGAAHLAVASTLAAKGRVAEAERVLFNVLRARPNDAGARWLLRQIREPSGAVPGRGPPKTKATPKPPQPEPEVPLEELFARLKGAPEPPGGRRVAELMKRLDREMGERETPMLVGVGPAPRMDLGPVRGRPAAGASVVTLSDLDDELAKKKARLAEERRRDMEVRSDSRGSPREDFSRRLRVSPPAAARFQSRRAHLDEGLSTPLLTPLNSTPTFRSLNVWTCSSTRAWPRMNARRSRGRTPPPPTPNGARRGSKSLASTRSRGWTASGAISSGRRRRGRGWRRHAGGGSLLRRLRLAEGASPSSAGRRWRRGGKRRASRRSGGRSRRSRSGGRRGGPFAFVRG